MAHRSKIQSGSYVLSILDLDPSIDGFFLVHCDFICTLLVLIAVQQAKQSSFYRRHTSVHKMYCYDLSCMAWPTSNIESPLKTIRFFIHLDKIKDCFIEVTQIRDGIPHKQYILVKLHTMFLSDHMAVLGLMAIQSFNCGISLTASTNFWQFGKGFRTSGMVAAHEVR